ncbi:MAG: hypothetical protein QF535_08210, partial [Anaerolineales bacterium]|nr:hypothetical protein [Anaerolineales bacterium]
MALFRFNFGDDADKSIFESGSNTDFHLYTRSTGTARTIFAGICVTGNSYLGNAAGDTTTVCGNLVVTGNTTTINSTTLQVDDKNIELGTVDTPTDITADGGGITLKGDTDKTILWTSSNGASWDFNQAICGSVCVDIPLLRLRDTTICRNPAWGVGYVSILGSGDNSMRIGTFNDNGWGYVENINNANGIYFNTNQGNFRFDTGSLGSYTDAEVDVGYSGARFRCGWFSSNMCVGGTLTATTKVGT